MLHGIIIISVTVHFIDN